MGNPSCAEAHMKLIPAEYSLFHASRIAGSSASSQCVGLVAMESMYTQKYFICAQPRIQRANFPSQTSTLSYTPFIMSQSSNEFDLTEAEIADMCQSSTEFAASRSKRVEILSDERQKHEMMLREHTLFLDAQRNLPAARERHENAPQKPARPNTAEDQPSVSASMPRPWENAPMIEHGIGFGYPDEHEDEEMVGDDDMEMDDGADHGEDAMDVDDRGDEGEMSSGGPRSVKINFDPKHRKSTKGGFIPKPVAHKDRIEMLRLEYIDSGKKGNKIPTTLSFKIAVPGWPAEKLFSSLPVGVQIEILGPYQCLWKTKKLKQHEKKSKDFESITQNAKDSAENSCVGCKCILQEDICVGPDAGGYACKRDVDNGRACFTVRHDTVPVELVLRSLPLSLRVDDDWMKVGFYVKRK